MIEEPIILYGDAGADVFLSIEAAEQYAEPIDIQNGEYTAYDAAGKILSLSVSLNGFHGSLSLPEPHKHGREELVRALRRLLRSIASARKVPFDQASIKDYSLKELLEICIQNNYYTQ